MAKAYKRHQELEYRSDRLISGRLLTTPAPGSGKDIPGKMRVFLGSRVKVLLRPEYEPFQCKTCGRVDELACHRHGLPKDFRVPKPRVDLHVTDEYLSIWSRRLAKCIANLAADHVYLFDLPGDPAYVVPWPKTFFGVPKGSRIYRDVEDPVGVAFRPYSRPCRSCGRYRSMTFWSDFFQPPDDLVLGAVGTDTDHYPRLFRLLTWIINPEIATQLRKKSFTNVAIKDSFAPPTA